MDDNSGSIRADRADFCASHCRGVLHAVSGVPRVRHRRRSRLGCGCDVGGLLLGSVPFVHMNFQLIILAIVFVSLLPALVSAARVYRARRNAPQSDPDPLVLPE